MLGDPTLQYIMLHTVVLASETVDRILMLDHSNESKLYKVVLPFESVDESWHVVIQMKAAGQYLIMVLSLIMLYSGTLI